jgi:hypothetical protein
MQKTMKKYIAYLGGALMLLGLASCEQDLPVYDDPQAYLNFDYTQAKDSMVNYSFVYSEGKEQDTVWVNLITQGFVSDHDRDFELQQVTTGNNDAQAGKHYVALDDARMKPYLQVKAGQTKVSVPIIVLKDASLDNAVYNLKLEVKNNGEFAQGFQNRRVKMVTITNLLSKPAAWSGAMDWYFGQWGRVKHQFFIDVTGEKWDDTFINSIVNNYSLVTYYISRLNKALSEENQRRVAAGQGLLQEADGTIVTIGY